MRILVALVGLAFLMQEKPEPSGPQLIERLKDPSTRASAYYELARRNGDTKAKSEAEFRNGHRSPELVLCPQGEGNPPIYALLSDFLSHIGEKGSFGRGSDGLFKAPAPGSRLKKRLIDAFSADGKRLDPFRGANVVDDGLFADINRAGFVVKVDGGGYSFEARKSVAVLAVSVVREKAELIFAVVYSFGARDSWSYDFIDEDGDGIPEIQLGPRTLEDEVVPRVSFKWDPAKKTYTGPGGGAGDHFRVIDPATSVWKEFARLEKEGVVFPPEEDRAGLRKVRKPAAAANTYSYVSLKGRSDEQLFAFMGRAAEEAGPNRRPEPVEPPGFWTLEPKAAALALVEANRSAKHRSQVQLAVDDRDGAAPGENGALRFTYESSRCYVAHDRHFLLQCRPKASFLLVVSTEGAGVVAAELGRKGRSQDVRFCSLDDAEARHLLQVIGWLECVRSKSDEADGFNSMSSTADGRGAMKLSFLGHKPGAAIEVAGTLWSDSIPARWQSLYTKETYLNFVQHLLESLAARRLERRRSPEFGLFEQEELPPVPKEVLEEQEKACAQLLELHLADSSLLPAGMVKAACDAAGDQGLSSVAPLLEKLKERGLAGNAPAEALRKIGAAQDAPALEKMALENSAKTDWALLQIKARFPEIYPRVLETHLTLSKDEEDAGRRLKELAGINVARARAFAATVASAATGPRARAAFAILRDAPAMADEAARVKAQLDVALNPGKKWQERCAAVDALVPARNPLRFPSQELDEALERIVKAPDARGNLDFTPTHAAAALERRRGVQYFGPTLARLKGTRDTFVTQQLLGTVTAMAQQGGDAERAPLVEYFKAHLKETDLMMSELCWEIWAADLRELKGDLERLASSGPGAEQSARADSAGGPAQPVTGKFHKARQVAQLWNEEDPVTRAKLTVALALDEAYAFTEDSHPSRRRRLGRSLSAAAKELSPDQRNSIVEFAAAFASKSVASETGPLLGIVREALK